jgi:large subunit ribosomal protein L23
MTNRNARLYELLIRPCVTEKATSLVENNQYTFEVLPEANKIELVQAFEKLYPGRKVTKIQTTKVYPQQKRVGRKMGHTSVGKKAIFTIQGEPLELFTGV